MNNFRDELAYINNRNAIGHVRIWDLSTKEILLDKSNLITNQGSDIAARALSGQPYTSISHMYIGYSSGTTVPSVALTDTISNFSTYARIPISFTPSYANESGYSNNLVYFTVYVTGTTTSGAATTTVPNGENILHLGLINATNPSASFDKLFSHIAFNPITYNSTNGIAITWGLTFRSS